MDDVNRVPGILADIANLRLALIEKETELASIYSKEVIIFYK